MNDSCDEAALITEMEAILKEKMAKDYKKGNTKRDAHPKSLGLVEGKFTVAPNLAEELKIGVFKTVKTFPAWIRFSNSSNKIQSDKKEDIRGMAIKLLGVEGERFSQLEQQSQDFVLLSHPTMPLGTVRLFRDAIYYTIKSNPIFFGVKLLFKGKLSRLIKLDNARKLHSSPLDIPFWSTTPYQFGDKIVKYKIVPTSSTKSEVPSPVTDNYLRENMQAHLNQAPASYDFYIQFFKDEQSTPTEDAGIEWEAADSPFHKVATLEIPKQAFDTPERKTKSENFSFSTANALLVHSPIGGLNRARNIIYASLSKFRHERDDRELVEPKT